MSLIKKISAGAVAAAMAISFTSCSDTSWVYKTDKSSLAAGVYISMMANAYISAVSQLSSSSSETDSAQSVWDQKIEDKDTETYIKDTARENANNYLAICDKFTEFKLSLTDEEKASADSTVDSMWEYFQNYVDFEESGASKESFKEYYLNSSKQTAVFNYYYDKGGVEEVKDKELKKYYYKNYRAAKLISMPLTDSDGNSLSEANIKKLKKQAKEYQERIKKGEKIDKLIKEYAKSTSGNTSDGNSANGSDNVVIVAKSNAESLFKKLKNAETGDAVYLNDSSSGYIYVGTAEDIKAYEDKYQDARLSVLSAYKSEDFNKLVENWTKNLKVTANNAAVKRYSPKNLVAKG